MLEATVLLQNIDLHALTGWVPERVAIRVGSDEFNPQREFTRICDRFRKGHCLVTVATGTIEKAEADRAGLVETHAYALLNALTTSQVHLLICSYHITSSVPTALLFSSHT
jgi:calpain-7